MEIERSTMIREAISYLNNQEGAISVRGFNPTSQGDTENMPFSIGPIFGTVRVMDGEMWISARVDQ